MAKTHGDQVVQLEAPDRADLHVVGQPDHVARRQDQSRTAVQLDLLDVNLVIPRRSQLDLPGRLRAWFLPVGE